MNVINKILHLINLLGTNDSKDFIEENKGDSNFLELLRLSSSPYVVFGLKKIEFDDTRCLEVYKDKYKEFINLTGLVIETPTNSDLRTTISEFLESCSKNEATVYSQILTKKLRLGVKSKNINKALGYELIPQFNVMLATAEDKAKFSFPVVAEEKYDGVRCLIIKEEGGIKAYTRQGRALILPKLFAELKQLSADNFVLDGELIQDSNRLLTTSAVNKILKGNPGKDLDKDLVFHAYDYMKSGEFVSQNCPDKQTVRSVNLEIFIKNNKGIPSFKLTNSRVISAEEELYEFYQEIRKKGGEGLVVKVPSSLYEWKRSKNWIKMKSDNTTTLEIVNVIEGEGKYSGMLGSITCKTSDEGIVTNVGSGLTDKQRVELWEVKPLGLFVEIKYINLEVTEKGDYFLANPVFKEIRIDKTEADSLEKIKKEAR